MKANVHEVTVWVLVDEQGNAVSSCDPDALSDLYADEVGGGANLARRVVCVTLKVPVQEYSSMTGTVPAEADGELVSAD